MNKSSLRLIALATFVCSSFFYPSFLLGAEDAWANNNTREHLLEMDVLQEQELTRALEYVERKNEDRQLPAYMKEPDIKKMNQLLKEKQTNIDLALAQDFMKRAYLLADYGDLLEALNQAEIAKSLDEDNFDIAWQCRQWRETLYPDKGTLEIIENFNKTHRLAASFSLKVLNDSNVVLEQVDPTTATLKHDTSISPTLSLCARWKAWDWNQTASYRYGGSFYLRFEAFEIQNHNLNYALNRKFKPAWLPAGHGLVGVFSLGASHFENAGVKLLYFGTGSATGVWLLPRKNGSLTSSFSLTDTSYYLPSASAQEGQNYRASLAWSRPWPKFDKLKMTLEGAYVKEDPKSAKSQYEAFGLKLKGNYGLGLKWLDSIQPSLGWENRTYNAPANAGENNREDDRWSAGLKLDKKLSSRHKIDLEAAFLNNQSTGAGKHYRKETVAFSYTLSL